MPSLHYVAQVYAQLNAVYRDGPDVMYLILTDMSSEKIHLQKSIANR